MKQKKIFYFFFLCILHFFACEKTVEYGDLTFWQLTGSNYGTTKVTINNIESTIQIDYGHEPGCNNIGCANFSLKTGTYYYTATCIGSNWNGIINIDKECTSILLF